MRKFNKREIKNEKSDFPQGVYTSSIERNMNSARCRAFPPELNTLSSPYLDGTLDPAEYGGALWELARGCPFKCSYCYESKGEKKIQYFPMERIEKELELLETYFFHDMSLKDTCEELYLHKNTLQYKLDKIHKTTGYNPRSFKHAAVLYIGLKLLKIEQ